MSPSRFTRKGFTLIELLVVIAIIAILAAINDPARFIILGDAGRAAGSASRGGMYPQPWAFDDSTQPEDKQQARPLARHNNGTTFAYADGHAKWSRLEQTWRTPLDNDWRRNPIRQ